MKNQWNQFKLKEILTLQYGEGLQALNVEAKELEDQICLRRCFGRQVSENITKIMEKG